jgi:hypothetical protein
LKKKAPPLTRRWSPLFFSFHTSHMVSKHPPIHKEEPGKQFLLIGIYRIEKNMSRIKAGQS